ncbi:MAG: sigma-54 interaction domain-containing protein [Bacillota bacterium]
MRYATVTMIDGKRRVGQKELNNYSYNELFDDIDDGVCIINESGTIAYVNRAYGRLLRISGHSEIGKSIFHTHNDEVILTAYRKKRPIKGSLSVYIGTNHISVAASPIFQNEVFKGVIAIYREESKTSDGSAEDKIITISVPQEGNPQKLDHTFKQIIGKSKVMEKALLVAQKSAKTSSTVLIRGESGTGKELVAQAIHYSSTRTKKPFVKVNCGSIPATLLESELFGHEQGSFTGAVRRKIGKFEQANGGTIFLDEIGDMPVEMQVKLLRVLQEKEFERVGGEETIKCDVRVVAATNRNLEELIEQGAFREDLYYRLNVIPIHLPSLRERKEDIPLLIRYFIEKKNEKLGTEVKGVAPEVETCFCKYDWPGNVRELENLMERLIALTDGEEINLQDIPSYISNLYEFHYHTASEGTLINLNGSGEIATLEEYEREIIKYAIERFGSFNAAGKALGVTHKTIAFKARKYNIVD